MKNNKYLSLLFLLAILVSAFFAGTFIQTASAQEECRDATGASIPCPPTKEIPCGQAGGPACPPAPVNDDDNDNGNQNSPPARATVTATPSSIVNPQDGEQDWSGTCSSKNKFLATCVKALRDACDNSAGSSSTTHQSNGDFIVNCTVPDPASQPAAEPTSMSIAVPTKDNLESTPLPISDQREEWLEKGWTGRCSKHNTSSTFPMSSCINNHLAACRNDQGTASQTTAKDGTVSVLCKDIYEGRPAGAFPWIGGGIVGILIGMLLPAIQKIRDAAARTPQTREHILLARQTQSKPADDGESLHRLFGDSDGDTPPPPPPKK